MAYRGAHHQVELFTRQEAIGHLGHYARPAPMSPGRLTGVFCEEVQSHAQAGLLARRLEGRDLSETREGVVPAPIAIRGCSRGAPRSLRAQEGGADTRIRSGTAGDGDRGGESPPHGDELEHRDEGLRTSIPRTLPSPITVQAGCLLPETRGIPSQDRVSPAFREGPGQSVGTRKVALANDFSVSPGEFESVVADLTASMSGPRCNASRKAMISGCLQTVDDLEATKSTVQLERTGGGEAVG